MTKKPVFKKLLHEHNPSSKGEIIQALIKKIQKITKRKLIVYITSPNVPGAMITRQDVFGFEDLLNTCDHKEKGDLLINSPGGEPNAAEKILMMLRAHFKEEFNVIIPDYAKSAATMISLGADKIIMGYSAELGPIDPQLQVKLGEPAIPAQAFLSGLDFIRKKVKNKKDPDPISMYLPVLNKIKPELISVCQNAIDHSKDLAERWLKENMLKNDKKQAKIVAKLLSEGKEYKSHGKVIDYKEAHDRLKLNVELIDKNSELWTLIWELYCRGVIYLQQINGVNLFASECVVLAQQVTKEE